VLSDRDRRIRGPLQSVAAAAAADGSVDVVVGVVRICDKKISVFLSRHST